MKNGRYKWLLLVFLFVTFFLELGTRQVYNAVLPQLKLDFAASGVNDAALGTVGTVFGAVFGMTLLASGLAADFFGRKRVIVLGTALFSAAIFGCGFAGGLGLLLALYGVLNAMGQCCVAPASYSLISQYHDNSTRSTAMAIFQAASYAGIVLCSWLSGVLADAGAGGWRRAFWLFGAIGVVWALVMQWKMRDTAQPEMTASGRQQELPSDGGAGVPSSADKPTVKAAFAALLTKPTAILIAVAFGMYMFFNFGIRLWTTAFLVREFPGVTLASAAFHAVFWINLGAFLGLFVTARVLDRVGDRRPRIRLEVSALGFLLCVPPMLAVAYAPSLALCCAALLVLGAAEGVYEAAHYPAMFDCVEPRYRSATTGITGCMAFLIGSGAPALLGWMGEKFTMRLSLASISGFLLLGALILFPAILRYFKNDYIGPPLDVR